MTAAPSVFNGKCIHGKDGAQIIKGVLISYNCDRCLANQELANVSSPR